MPAFFALGCQGLFQQTAVDHCKPRRTYSRQRYCRAQASPGTTAVDAAPGLLFTKGEPGAWDEAGVGHPIVRYYLGDNEQRWYMWYTGRSAACRDLDAVFPSSGSVGVAVSKDGISWARGSGAVEGARGEAKARDVGRVLAPNPDWWWHDTCHVHAADVQIMSNGMVGGGTGVYWMFYSGGSFEEADLPAALQSDDIGRSAASSPSGSGSSNGSKLEGFRLRPGLAMSQDGRNWARIEAGHHTGALFDVGQPGEWDELFIGAPQVVAVGPTKMLMYYHSFDQRQGKFVVGVATSRDGMRWDKQGGPVFEGGSQAGDFDAGGASNRHVVRDVETKQFLMFYEAVASDGARSIGLAVSQDGLSGWKRCPQPVLTPSSSGGAWDSSAVGTPCAVSMAEPGRWRLYYAGRQQRAGAWQGIGLALSQPEGPSFEGIPITFTRRKGSQE